MILFRQGAAPARTKTFISIVALAASLGYAASAQAAGTIAGTQIENVATATFDGPDGDPTSIDSNKVTLKVDELLDVAVAGPSGDVATAPSATDELLTFTVTNAGNGTEAFKLTVTDNGGGDDFDPSVTGIFLDANDNHVYDAGIDTAYVAGSNDPVLDPDQSITVFILSDIPSSAGNTDRGRVDLNAEAVTGSGPAGTTFAGQGQGGGDAVVGLTTADADASGYYAVSAATLSLVKSAVVDDPFGGHERVPGATITYKLVASASGTGSVDNVKVSDTVPTGTTYQADSITLDTDPLTDTADSDEGAFASNAISVDLGSVAASSTYTITFKVKID
jgi:uncharacterized repeat protein (TIGR01451 family)